MGISSAPDVAVEGEGAFARASAKACRRASTRFASASWISRREGPEGEGLDATSSLAHGAGFDAGGLSFDGLGAVGVAAAEAGAAAAPAALAGVDSAVDAAVRAVLLAVADGCAAEASAAVAETGVGVAGVASTLTDCFLLEGAEGRLATSSGLLAPDRRRRDGRGLGRLVDLFRLGDLRLLFLGLSRSGILWR